MFPVQHHPSILHGALVGAVGSIWPYLVQLNPIWTPVQHPKTVVDRRIRGWVFEFKGSHSKKSKCIPPSSCKRSSNPDQKASKLPNCKPQSVVASIFGIQGQLHTHPPPPPPPPQSPFPSFYLSTQSSLLSPLQLGSAGHVASPFWHKDSLKNHHLEATWTWSTHSKL